MAGCVDHLNKSAGDLFLPVIDQAIAQARAGNLKSDGPFAYSAFERWLTRNNDAPPKMKFKAVKKFQPSPRIAIDRGRSDFIRWQDELDRRIHEADGLDLRRAKGTWPFWPLKWSLGGLILMMIAHERRHVWQARTVRQNPAFPAQ